MKAFRVLSSLFLIFGLGSAASATSTNMQICAIQAFDGHFLTAVGGGGRTQDVIHSNATAIGAWEKFRVRPYRRGGGYALQTVNGHFLTAVGGGGRTQDVIHSDARVPSRWERFNLIPLGNEVYAIRTMTGNYITAQDSGGRVTDVLHTDAVRIGTWERFRFICGFAN